MSINATIDLLMVNHDVDPMLSAQQIVNLVEVGIDENEVPRLAWLINHVVGELRSDWRKAYQLQCKLRPQSKNRVVLRHRAVAALFAGEVLDAWREQDILCQETGASHYQVEAVVRLGVLQHEAAHTQPSVVGRILKQLLMEIRSWSEYGPLGDIFAGTLNNIVSCLLDHENFDITDVSQCDAIEQGALLCREIWQVVGNWMNVERADYLVALTCNRIGRWEDANKAALSGINIILDNGGEDVDRAFLLLELARSYQGLGEGYLYIQTREAAFALAENFQDHTLREWFDSRAAA